MKLSAKIVILPTILACLVSCGEEHALKEETLYFQEQNSGWIYSDSPGDNFVMTDNNGIAQSFTLHTNSHEFSKSWSSVLGINTHMTYAEYQYLDYASSYGISFSLALTAGFEPFGDMLYIELDRIGFGYDLDYMTLSRINTDFGNKSKLMTDSGYEPDGDEINSTVELLETYSTTQHDYDSVLHFQFRDFKEAWNEFTVTDIYLAKNIGLIRFELRNGVFYERN